MPWIQLPFAMEHQLQDNWCWAANAASAATYFAGTQQWRQCEVVNAELHETRCCGSVASTSACNVPWYLDSALATVGHPTSLINGPLTFGDVQRAIDAGNPVCCRVGWSGGGGHFVAIVGYSETIDAAGVEQVISIADPWYGNSDSPYDAFRTAYQNDGSWTHSFVF